ncbi:MAG: hypothetical protein LQ342_007977 [Letrouitia transgressa]|nr:MAG: hypothetical protein LQ342_007977 [Letrouitia transgressa]
MNFWQTWNTGLLFSDNCGYLALSHPPAAPRIILAFRGTYSLANTVTDLSTLPQEYTPYPGQKECANCTVHAGFINSWTLTKPLVVNHLETLRKEYPGYQLTLVGHSLGGAIAALASLDFQAVGWKPKVTTFGEPKVGNIHLVQYFDRLFRSNQSRKGGTYRRVTHVGDPIPLLPLDEMGFRAHAGEIFISKPEIRPEVTDLYRCDGDDDPECIAGSMTQLPGPRWFRRLLARLRVWQLFTAHRDYFWRLGLCVSGGDPTS